jgi:hypothetical protein
LNLADAYNNSNSPATVTNPVHQLYTYMCVLKLKYGFLTTYNTWWFCTRGQVKRKKKGSKVDQVTEEVLYISEPITPSSEGPTLGEAFAYFALTTVRDPRAIEMKLSPQVLKSLQEQFPSYPNEAALNNQRAMLTERMRNEIAKLEDTAGQQTPLPDASSGGGGGGGGKQASWSVSTLAEPAMMQVIPSLPLAKLKAEPVYGRVLGRGRTGVAMLAHIEGFPLPVAIKIADLAKMEYAEDELKNEFKAYLRMVSLWGTVVPFLVWSGRMAWGRAGLATSLAGKRTLEGPCEEREPIDMEALELSLRDGLAQIHALGVAHNDIELKNIVVDCANGVPAMFIDFGNAFVGDGSNDFEVRQAQEQDLAALEEVLRVTKRHYVGTSCAPAAAAAAADAARADGLLLQRDFVNGKMDNNDDDVVMVPREASVHNNSNVQSLVIN